MPRSTSSVAADGTHSSSSGRDAGPSAASGSSVIESRASNTSSPTRAARGELPCSTVLPESAFTSEPRDQAPAQPDQLVEGGVGGAVEKGGDVGEPGCGGKGEIERLSQVGRCAGAIHQRREIRRRR